MSKKHAPKKIQKNIEYEDFVNYLHSPKRLILTNLLAGIFRGIGGVLGATLVVALLFYVLNIFVDFPLIGQYFEDLKNILDRATQV